MSIGIRRLMISLLFLSAITRLFHNFFISFPESLHFTVMSAIDVATVRRSEALLRLRWPRTEMATPPASTTPSTSAPLSSAGGVTLKAIMA